MCCRLHRKTVFCPDVVAAGEKSGTSRQVNGEPIRGSPERPSKGLSPLRKSQTELRGRLSLFSLYLVNPGTQTTHVVTVEENPPLCLPDDQLLLHLMVSLNSLSFTSSPVRPLNYSTFSASFCFKHFDENLGQIGSFDI